MILTGAQEEIKEAESEIITQGSYFKKYKPNSFLKEILQNILSSRDPYLFSIQEKPIHIYTNWWKEYYALKKK